MNITKQPKYLNQVPYWIFLYQEGVGYKKIASVCTSPASTVRSYLKFFGILEDRRNVIYNLGSRNGMWSNETLSSSALHAWVRRNKPKIDVCELCRSKPSLDLCNISPTFNPETYNREFINWRYLCRGCHMKSDGRMENLKQYVTK